MLIPFYVLIPLSLFILISLGINLYFLYWFRSAQKVVDSYIVNDMKLRSIIFDLYHSGAKFNSQLIGSNDNDTTSI